MLMAIPMEVIDINCRDCPNFKPQIESSPVYDDDRNLIGHIVNARYANLQFCREGLINGPIQ